jgi:hypothetical protein
MELALTPVPSPAGEGTGVRVSITFGLTDLSTSLGRPQVVEQRRLVTPCKHLKAD